MKTTFIIIILLYSTIAFGWHDTTTHRDITNYAITQFFDSDFLLESFTLGNETKRAAIWLRDGSELEDQSNIFGFPSRSLNHFHDPTKPLAQAGLSDLVSGRSAVLWAQNPVAQSNTTGGDWTWQQVRNHYYNYLTAPDKTTEETSLVQTLLGLGYQMHLIEDMSQPNHVRNQLKEAML